MHALFSACSNAVLACLESMDKNGECEQCERLALKENDLPLLYPAMLLL